MPSPWLLAVHFARFGPYHFARLHSAVEALGPHGWSVKGFQTASDDATYGWAKEDQAGLVTVFSGRVYEEVSAEEMRRGVFSALDRLRPDAVAIAGWGFPDSRACLEWCRKNRVQAILMSETRASDGRRVWWKEWLKSRLVRRFDAALVGGRSHADYLVRLGMPRERMALGYDVIDDSRFAAEAEKWRRGANDESRFFLASNRFIERKNLARLIQAYAEYRTSFPCSGFRVQPKADRSTLDARRPTPPRNLCLLGDGEQRGELSALARSLGLSVAECAPWEEVKNAGSGEGNAGREEVARRVPSLEEAGAVGITGFQDGRTARCPQSAVGALPTVFFPGFRQIEELPRFYASAACFIHPALEEPWGLVLNEAAACGLPILAGNNVGAAEELVEEGVNGWTFDANKPEAIAAAMIRFSELCPEERERMGKESSRILHDRAPSNAFGKGMLACLSHRQPSK